MNHKNPQHEERVTGLLLHAISHLRGKYILKILSPNQGLITIIGRSSNRELLTPFHIAEWIYKMGRGDMGKLVEGSIEERFSFDTYSKLQAAGQISSDLLRTQMPGTPAEVPFELARACFKAIERAENPALLGLAFRLKLLRIEGILNLDLAAPRDLEILQFLCNSRSFQEIQSIPLTEELKRSVDRVFVESLH